MQASMIKNIFSPFVLLQNNNNHFTHTCTAYTSLELSNLLNFCTLNLEIKNHQVTLLCDIPH